MQASVNERELVLDMLLQITRDGEYSHIVIKNVLDKYQYLDKRERAFITRVVNGTLERMIEIDYIINLFSKVKVNKNSVGVRFVTTLEEYRAFLTQLSMHNKDLTVVNFCLKEFTES